MADLQAGRYDLALLLGVELMRNVPAADAAAKLGAAAWVPRETEGLTMVWPEMFSRVGDEYERRYGLRREHLVAIARSNFASARNNPNAQTRRWVLPERAFDADAPENPHVAGRLHKLDCSQITDGGAAVLLASDRFLASRAPSADKVARIVGFGHRTSRMALADKLEDSRGDAYLF